MALPRLFTRRLLSPGDVPPSGERFRVCGVLNPAVTEHRGRTVVIARVAEEPTEHRPGSCASPRVDAEAGRVVDYLPADRCNADDPRVYAVGPDRLLRLRFISHLRVMTADDPYRLDPADAVIIEPEGEYEEYGIEDPRVTRIGSTYYITYVAVSRHGVATALMSTTDFESFARHGIIFCPDNKDVLLLPEKIAGSYVAIHRPMHKMPFCPPQMWLARSLDLLHWGAHEPLFGGGRVVGVPQDTPEGDDAHADRVGGSTPPIATDAGWLTLYHGSERPADGRTVGRYTAGALLLDRQNPSRILARSREPILVPEADFETAGYVDQVIFPTALIDRDDRYEVYYGAADQYVGVCGLEKRAVTESLHPA